MEKLVAGYEGLSCGGDYVEKYGHSSAFRVELLLLNFIERKIQKCMQ